ncbi:uncharacterized protein EKO05_0004273 [Ascochyta rabiei]|uniref:uncharacterized protein n=1 Tax=Didymella rabiei TaxID=5454 RepID=UPI00220276E0|nr:uncharacterized protein EKO05_0004273 [Ascochyta rabiei]UPX13774.1 hypothetical protein EKO05_0004273 [Ascochyta rabiei]
MHHQARNRQPPPSQPTLSAFLRAVGLDALNVLKNKLSGYNTRSEPTKLIHTTSLRTTLQRCAVHLLPCAFSIFLISINLQGYFIGFELAGQPGRTSQYIALLQIAAKAQELLIVASLATVVVHRIRHDLIDGEGVPFGLVGAGSLFSQLSYFWSTAFIGSVSRGAKLNATLVGLLLLAGLVAVTAGPAVAVLLVPREQTWSAGGTKYWINGTTKDLWPSRVGLEHYMPETGAGLFGASCSSTKAYTNALCPAGGYLSLMNRFSSSDYSRPWSGTRDSRYTPVGLLVWSPMGQMPPYNMASAQRARTALESSAVGIHGPASWVAATINEDWQVAVDSATASMNSRISRYRYYSTMRSVMDTWVPAVRVVCSDRQSFAPGQRTLQFPVVPEFGGAVRNNLIFDDQNPGEPRELRTVQLSDETLKNLNYTQHARVSAIDLSNVSWTTATTGIIIEHAWDDKTSHSVSSCVVDARWAKGAVSVGLAQAVQTEVYSVTRSVKNSLVSSGSYRAFDMFNSNSGPRDSWRRINITDEWFNSINLPLSNDTNIPYSLNTARPADSNASTVSASDMTTISALLALTASSTSSSPAIEHTLASIFADALSRAGTWRMLNITLPVSNKTPHLTIHHMRIPDFRNQLLHSGEAYSDPSLSSPTSFTPFEVSQIITGYAFKTSSTTDILALAVVILHLAIALAHTTFLLLRRRSSACWDSVPELLALAQQSRKSELALHNTATGIQCLDTFRQRTRIRVSEEDSTRVEVRFDTDVAAGVHKPGKPRETVMYG